MTKERTLVTIPHFLDDNECDAMVASSEGRGYEAAPVTTSRGFVMMPELRNNTRVMVDDPALAATLWQRLRARAESGLLLARPPCLRHQGSEVRRGRKYVLRSDVMFERAAP